MIIKMKKVVSFLLCTLTIFSFFSMNTNASEYESFVPYVIDFTVTTDINTDATDETNSRASGLILSYGLSLTKTGNSLYLEGRTNCTGEVVKCGFKDLTVQRRATSSDSWEDYYEYGNVYAEATAAFLSTTLAVESGYQYRIYCKHYAKKNIFSVETISNTSNIVTVS